VGKRTGPTVKEEEEKKEEYEYLCALSLELDSYHNSGAQNLEGTSRSLGKFVQPCFSIGLDLPEGN
jgi:hypothetical protein